MPAYSLKNWKLCTVQKIYQHTDNTGCVIEYKLWSCYMQCTANEDDDIRVPPVMESHGI